MTDDTESGQMSRRRFAHGAVFGTLAGLAANTGGTRFSEKESRLPPAQPGPGAREASDGEWFFPSAPPAESRTSFEKRTDYLGTILSEARRQEVREVVLPDACLPYDADAVSFPEGVRLSRSQSPSGWYDILAYGAVRDRSRDSTEAIRAAVDAATASPPANGLVWCPSGEYKVSGTISLDERLIVLGAGEDQTRIVAPRHHTRAIFRDATRDDVDYLRMENLGIYGGLGAVGESVGLQLHDVHQWTLRNVLIRYCRIGLDLEFAFTGSAERCTINQNRTGVRVQDTANNVTLFSQCNLGFNDVNIDFDEEGAGGKNMKFDTVQLEVTSPDQVAVRGAPFGVVFENCYTEGSAHPIVLKGAERCTFRHISFTEGAPVFRLAGCRNVRIAHSFEHDDFNPTAKNSHFLEAVDDNHGIEVDGIYSPGNAVFLGQEDLLRHVRLGARPVTSLTDLEETVDFRDVDPEGDEDGWEVTGDSAADTSPGLMNDALKVRLETYDRLVYRLPERVATPGTYSAVLIYRVHPDSEAPVELACVVDNGLRPIRNSEGARVKLPDAVRGEWGVTSVSFQVSKSDGPDVGAVAGFAFRHRGERKTARFTVDSLVLLVGEEPVMETLPYDVARDP